MRKTKCPNCGRGFPVKDGRGPQRIECPFCGMRGMMP
jgi:DNA-directed RNA polymerase subunit RPC12/RpoP